MRRKGRIVRNEKGIVLVIALMLLMVVMLLGTTAVFTTTTDLKISGNYGVNRQAFSLAEAGLEHGKIECVKRYQNNGWGDFTPLLNGSDTTAVAGLTFGSVRNFSGGTYTVTVSNDSEDSGEATIDTNGTVTITSIGRFKNGASTVRATIVMNELPPIPGAINLVGEAEGHFDDNAFLIEGWDCNLDGTPANPDKPLDGARYGISVCDVTSPVWGEDDAAAKGNLINALSAQQREHVQGKDYAVGDPVIPSVGVTGDLTKKKMNDFVNLVKICADNTVINPDELKNDAVSAAGNIVTIGSQSFSLGTISDPKTTYIDMTMHAPGSEDAVWTISGNITGAGLLLINGADILLKSSIEWNGLIVVYGDKVGCEFRGGGANTQSVTGGIIICETGMDKGSPELYITGNPSVRYSPAGVDLVKAVLQKNRPYTVLSWVN